MKKFLLILLIVILLGGCGLGGWYFLTNKNEGVVGLKLELTNTAKIFWLDDYSETEKTEILGGKSETLYISTKKDGLYNEIPVQKFSFLKDGVVECYNNTTATNRYYLVSPNGKTLNIYKDETYMNRYEFNYGIPMSIIKDSEGYWLIAEDLPYEYENRGYVVFKLK